MSAQDCVNEKQFMSINELKGLKTIDAPSGDKTVGDLLDKKRGEILDAPEYNSVRQNMKRQGQTAPLGVSKNHDWLLDGHHRVAIAEDLGWEKMEVSSDVLKSSDLDFDRKHRW